MVRIEELSGEKEEKLSLGSTIVQSEGRRREGGRDRGRGRREGRR